MCGNPSESLFLFGNLVSKHALRLRPSATEMSARVGRIAWRSVGGRRHSFEFSQQLMKNINMELIPGNKLPIITEDKSFHFRISLHSDLIQAFVSYMSLFKRFCRVVKNKKVFINIKRDENEVVFELGKNEM